MLLIIIKNVGDSARQFQSELNIITLDIKTDIYIQSLYIRNYTFYL